MNRYLLGALTLASLFVAQVGRAGGHEHAGARRPSRCTVRIDTRSGALRINGVSIIKGKRGMSLAAIRAALGAPSRTIKRQRRSRFERFGDRSRGIRPHSTRVTVHQTHYVYDAHGLVFLTAARRHRGRLPRDPSTLLLQLRAPTGFRHGLRATRPRSTFSGRLWINARRVRRGPRLVPAAVSYRTRTFRLFGARFAPTSRATVVDSLYAQRGRRAVRIYLDDARHQRAALVEVK